MQDWFNEWHAKNTSDKVRKVFKSKGESGKPLTSNPPFGYMKSPDDKYQWIIDEPAAEIVKRIFKMCVSGMGPSQIANKLSAEKVPTPTEYWISVGRKCGKPPSVPFHWCPAMIANILKRQEYCGDTVNFRSTTKSFKNKKRVDRPESEWIIFENTHPAIVDRDTFKLVQKIREGRHRQHGRAKSVSFRDWCSVRIADRRCTTNQARRTGEIHRTLCVQAIPRIPTPVPHTISARER